MDETELSVLAIRPHGGEHLYRVVAGPAAYARRDLLNRDLARICKEEITDETEFLPEFDGGERAHRITLERGDKAGPLVEAVIYRGRKFGVYVSVEFWADTERFPSRLMDAAAAGVRPAQAFGLGQQWQTGAHVDVHSARIAKESAHGTGWIVVSGQQGVALDLQSALAAPEVFEDLASQWVSMDLGLWHLPRGLAAD